MSRNYDSGNNYPPQRVESKGNPLRVSALLLFAAFSALSVLATSCVYDHYNAVSEDDGGMVVELSIVTRAINSDSETYEQGTTWENYVNFAGGDYRIYFFTNDKNDATATDDSERNTLIAEFTPQEMTAVEETDYTQYTIAGEVGDNIVAYSDFKVVVLANWGAYPTVTAGTTTIDALVEGDNTTFSAETFLTGVDESHLIPFYGVREYSNVEWREGWRTTLEGDITLLRALAKVEVVLSEDSGIDGFDSVSIVRYNESGYCAPKGVYLKADYDSGYTDWAGDFADTIHLVGGVNDSGASSNTYSFTQQTGTDTDTWVIYLPEYDNTSDSEDYSFIRVTLDDIDYEIYFSNYTDGSTSSTADYDIYRNHLYRFVTDLEDVVAGGVESWKFGMDVKQYVTAVGAPSIYATFDAYYYEQDDDEMTIKFPIMDVVSVFVMIPSLTYNGKDITAEADWVCTASNGASVIVTKNPTVSEGPVEIHVSSLTATTGYIHYLTLSATWTGDDGSEKEITYELTVSVVNERPVRDTSDTYVEPTD